MTDVNTAEVQENDEDEGGGLRLNVTMEEKVEIARATAQRIFELVGAGLPEISVTVEEDQIIVHLSGVNPALQPQGDTRALESIQFILNKAVNKLALKRTRLSLDAEGFRRRRPEGLDRIADSLAAKALQLGKAIALGPLGQGDLRFLGQQASRTAGVDVHAVGPHERRRLVIGPQAANDEEAGEGEEEGVDAAGQQGGRRRRRRRR